jgi:BrnA antitoxin of type II toxin-antitoxin system
MKKEYDFSRGRRGAVLGAPPGKTRITIRIDNDILQWFRDQMHKAGGGSYQTAMNDALRRVMGASESHVEGSLRRVLREELRAYRVRPKSTRAPR